MELESQENSSSKVGSVILVILVLVALALSYFLYQRVNNTGTPSAEYTPTQNNNSPSVTTPNNNTTGQPNTQQLSADERAVLQYPSPDVTPEAWNAYLTLVAKVAVETNVLTIGQNCSVSPVVLRTRSKEVTLKNTDSVAHTIAFTSPFFSGTIPPNGSLKMPVDFKGQLGLYGYGCDGSAQAVGLMDVVE